MDAHQELTAVDPLTGNTVRVDGWGRYRTCRWCGDDLPDPRGKEGRPKVQCAGCGAEVNRMGPKTRRKIAAALAEGSL